MPPCTPVAAYKGDHRIGMACVCRLYSTEILGACRLADNTLYGGGSLWKIVWQQTAVVVIKND